ncbi:hypothetical protein [Mycolicibacterium gilvum]|uniref:hypothetical protein n=1 Tax=Mycolicibacterium gilvum TaxID=1804 RepID=UPI0040455EFF
MAKHAKAPARSVKKLGAVGLGAFFAASAFSGLSAATASADVEELAPQLQVYSRQASQNAVIRINDPGAARGISEGRLADAGEILANGTASTEVRDTTKAVVAKKAQAFRGAFPVGPSQGDW